MAFELPIQSPEDLAQARLEAQARAIKAKREAVIAAGITFKGRKIATDDRGQTRLTAAAMAALLGPDQPVHWKGETGLIACSAPEIEDMLRAMRAHIQAAFDHEAALLAQLACGADVDPESGWPKGSDAPS